ncbi:LOW QUALITY PROTEIN: hypothetical protein Cgig2_027421 [Carnegiea gigantea]|uniref:DUF4283 domain-containing protein n=1 Tax=Carnegiea gigantea TaxID=171969 RepID=A0A9Q1H016_9CARY|nr:LOW QUALITY PROTEIN: hypothetical protein Cgig2_027421 [Carnegiea gigantea]
MEQDEILKIKFVYFDKKLMVLKPWSIDQPIEKAMIAGIPVWSKFPKRDLKFWDRDCLSNIASLMGHWLLTRQQMRKLRPNLFESSFKRISMDKYGNFVRQGVDYEWKPIQCEHWKLYGREIEGCRKKTKRVWRMKETYTNIEITENPEPANDPYMLEHSNDHIGMDTPT